MKQMIYGLVSFGMLALLLGVILTIQGRAIRTDEVTLGLEEAMNSSMQQLCRDRHYTIQNREEFVADFLELLLLQMNSNSDVTVRILRADEKRGLLSVEVVETYLHPNGEKGSVSAQRTILLERTGGESS